MRRRRIGGGRAAIARRKEDESRFTRTGARMAGATLLQPRVRAAPPVPPKPPAPAPAAAASAEQQPSSEGAATGGAAAAGAGYAYYGGGVAGSNARGTGPDPAIVAKLVSMGFSENGCKRAALATDNAGIQRAMEWVLQHFGDSNFDAPL